MAINFNNQNRGIGTLDLSEYGLLQPQNQNMQVAGGYDTPTEGQYGFNLIELDRLKNAGYDPAEVSTYPNQEDVQSLIRSLEPTAMAISNYEQLFGPRTMTDANQSLYTGVMDQSGNPVDLSNRNINTTEPYQDLIMNPDNMPNRLQNLERFADNRFENLDFQPGFDFKDAPNKTSNLIESYQNRSYLNNPNRGIIDNLILSRGNPDASLVNKTKNKGKKGFNIGKQGLLTALGFATKAPLGLLSLVGKMLPERDYRQNVVEDFYSDPNTRGLVSRIPGMENYNTVSGGLLNALTGGKMGEETTFGLSGAIDKRMERINKTLKKKKSAVLEQRLKDLQALKDREAKALADARAKQSANLESQRRGRRPGSGGDGPGTKDSGGPTGGYSYDSGGRKGFGYGL
jgi:predicted transcriptional regulator